MPHYGTERASALVPMSPAQAVVEKAPAKRINRLVGAVAGLIAVCAAGIAAPAAAADNRTLNLYNTHTKERLTITFKKNGRYVPSALSELNRFLRDWRRNEPTKMDPRLFDTVWEVYRQSGASQPIHVVSAYRSLTTNNMLRSRSRGVAKTSQHTAGKAMDMFIPGVSVNKLREIGVRLQRGGVGWYPTAGSPFVHIDVGNVRAWPRMTRNQLVKLFPDGKTVHLPADGKPLAGYQQALAELKRRGSVASPLMAAADEEGKPRKRGLLAMLFGDGEDAETELSAAASTATVPSRSNPDDDPVRAGRNVVKAPSTARPVRTEVETPVRAEAPVRARVAPAPAPAPAPVIAEPAPAPVVEAPVVIAAVPRPAPARPAAEVEAPAPASLADAVLPNTPPALPPVAPEPEVVVADAAPAPIPREKPAELIALAVAEAAKAASAELEQIAAFAPLPPRARSEAGIQLASAADGLDASGRPEPLNARQALAEVANDTTPTVPQTVLGYASPTLAAEPQRKPPLRTAKLSPPAPITRGLAGPTDAHAALPLSGDKSDPLARLTAAPADAAAAVLPIYDGAQSAYWGVYARLAHPDQRRMGALFAEPQRVLASSFGTSAYAGLTSTRFAGDALPRLQVLRFTPTKDLAMR